uniref:HMG box domain-containing protein n=1 Tax=Lotharella globosa TaxID=91324 RepID=A0A6V3K6Q5_9EUKA
MQALMIAALSAERVQCFDSKEDQSAPTREPDSPPPIKNQRDEPTDVGNHTTSHEEIRVMKPVAPRSRYYRVVVRDGVCFRIHPDISAICPDGSGVPYGDIIEAMKPAPGEMVKEEPSKASGWIRVSPKGYWLPTRMYGTTVLEPVVVTPALPESPPADNTLFDAVEGLSSMNHKRKISTQLPVIEPPVQSYESSGSHAKMETEGAVSRGIEEMGLAQGRSRRARAGGRRAKQPKTAYNFYQLDVRAQVSAELKRNLAASGQGGRALSHERLNQEVMRLIGKRWRSLDPAERNHYQAKAAADARRYHNELRAYDSKGYEEESPQMGGMQESPSLRSERSLSRPSSRARNLEISPRLLPEPVVPGVQMTDLDVDSDRRSRTPGHDRNSSMHHMDEYHRRSPAGRPPRVNPGVEASPRRRPRSSRSYHVPDESLEAMGSRGSRAKRKQAPVSGQAESKRPRGNKRQANSSSFAPIKTSRRIAARAQQKANGVSGGSKSKDSYATSSNASPKPTTTPSHKPGRGRSRSDALLPCPKCNASDRSIRNGWSRMQSHKHGGAKHSGGQSRVQRFRCRRCNLDYRAVAPPGAPPPPDGAPMTFSITLSQMMAGQGGRRGGRKGKSGTKRKPSSSPAIGPSPASSRGPGRPSKASKLAAAKEAAEAKSKADKASAKDELKVERRGRRPKALSLDDLGVNVNTDEEARKDTRDWSCPVCTLVIKGEKLTCEACGMKKPRASRPMTKSPPSISPALTSQKEQWKSITDTPQPEGDGVQPMKQERADVETVDGQEGKPASVGSPLNLGPPAQNTGDVGNKPGTSRSTGRSGVRDKSREQEHEAEQEGNKYLSNKTRAEEESAIKKKQRRRRRGTSAFAAAVKAEAALRGGRSRRRRGEDPNYEPGQAVQVKWCSTWYNVYIEDKIPGRKGFYSAFVQNARMDFHFNKIRWFVIVKPKSTEFFLKKNLLSKFKKATKWTWEIC